MTTAQQGSGRKLTLSDISDLREYERERDEFRSKVIALKKRRRVHVGPFVTMVFENRDTMRFQIQEMARVERLISDDAIETELAIYNPLIPEPGELALTMFIELTSDDELREWLPKLVGVERTVALRLGSAADATTVEAIPEAAHQSQLTREETTSSVHYLQFRLDDFQIDALEAGPVALLVRHPEYPHETQLGAATISELLADLRP